MNDTRRVLAAMFDYCIILIVGMASMFLFSVAHTEHKFNEVKQLIEAKIANTSEQR